MTERLKLRDEIARAFFPTPELQRRGSPQSRGHRTWNRHLCCGNKSRVGY